MRPPPGKLFVDALHRFQDPIAYMDCSSLDLNPTDLAYRPETAQEWIQMILEAKEKARTTYF